MLEEEVLCIPITEGASPLLPTGPRVTLDLVPLASERVNDLAPYVSHDLGSRREVPSRICAQREVQMCQPMMLPIIS